MLQCSLQRGLAPAAAGSLQLEVHPTAKSAEGFSGRGCRWVLPFAAVPGSMLLVREGFQAGDPGFLTELFRCVDDGPALKALAKPWAADERPFGRRTLLRYVDDGCDRPGHRPLVKKLFKDAEDRQDDELMRHFMVAFDRLIRTRLIDAQWWNGRTRELETYKRRVPIDDGPYDNRFSLATRRYLRRRVYRYFRHIGYRDPARYVANMLEALRLYADEDTAEAVQLLDRWSLFHVLYWGAKGADRRHSGVVLRGSATRVSFAPSPHFPDEWRRQAHLDDLIRLMAEAKNADVRAWVRAWIEADPSDPFESLSLSRLWPLLKSPNIDVQEWSATLLERVNDWATQTIAGWVELLKLDNEAAAQGLADRAAKWLAPSRLSLDLAVEVAQTAKAPVARLLMGWLLERTVTKADLPILIRLAQTADPMARARATRWLTTLLAKHRSVLLTRELLDSPHADVRASALELINSHYVGAAPLAVALIESPFTDVRDEVVRHLEGWIARIPSEKAHHLWARTLLSIHNGGRAKRAVLRQLAETALRADAPSETMPLLAVALRSVRESERRAALAAIARIVHRQPELRSIVHEAIPELSWQEAIA